MFAGAFLVAFGLLSSFGLVGFAKASDVQNQGTVLSSIQRHLVTNDERELRNDIRAAKKDMCIANDNGSDALLQSAAKNLEDAKYNFKQTVGYAPDVPSCDEVRIKGLTVKAQP